MRSAKTFISLFVLLLLLNFIPLNAQKYGVALDGGQFIWRVEPKNSQARWEEYKMNAIYPADFSKDPGYTSLLHGGIGYYSVDKGHSWQPSDASGILKNGPSGGVTAGDQNKIMRYSYPVITVDGEDAGRYQDPEFIVDPTLECEMKGLNRARSLMGITCYTTTYSWSHPAYQNIIIQHDQYVNDGNWFKHWDPTMEDTVDANTYPEFFISNHRWYIGGYKSDTFPRREGTGPDNGLFETNWNFWGYGVTDGITDSTEILQYQWNPDQREASPLDDEGEWNIEDHRFWYPYYFGFGYLDASGP